MVAVQLSQLLFVEWIASPRIMVLFRSDGIVILQPQVIVRMSRTC